MSHRKPTALKEREGTAQPCRLNPYEPMPTRGVPVAPKHLNAEAKRYYQAYAQLLDEMGVVTIVDAPILELIANVYADLREAERNLKARGSKTYEATTRDSGVIIRKYPEVDMIPQLRTQLITLLARCGLTPSDRAKVNATLKDTKHDEFAEFKK